MCVHVCMHTHAESVLEGAHATTIKALWLTYRMQTCATDTPCEAAIELSLVSDQGHPLSAPYDSYTMPAFLQYLRRVAVLSHAEGVIEKVRLRCRSPLCVYHLMRTTGEGTYLRNIARLCRFAETVSTEMVS